MSGPLVDVDAVSTPSGVRILIVDDEPRARRVLATAMARAGFHVLTADDGAPALLIAAQTPPDLAIVDFHMKTPGLEVVRKLKALHGAAIWVAVLSGLDDEAIRAASFAAGADDFLTKPVTLAHLKRRMIAAARTQQAFVESRLAGERADRQIIHGAEAAATLAHALNNDLAIALSNMTYLHEVVQLGDDETQALGVAVAALRRMAGLVANFVDIPRLEGAAVKPRSVTTNVSALIHKVLDAHTATPLRAIRYEVDCAPALLGRFDVALIQRVLHNLIGNAVRHCDAKGLVRILARPWNPADPASCEITVFNTGPCVPELLRPAMFVKNTRDRDGKHGVGLYFCRLACEAHGGTIEYGADHDGSRFTLRLPGGGSNPA